MSSNGLPTSGSLAELRLPADGAYVAVLRTTTAALAARLDFTIDDIEDLRIAVGEASALVLEHAPEGAHLDTRFVAGEGELTVVVAVATPTPPVPDLDSFAWQVLTTLASSADIASADGRFEVSLTMRSAAAPATPSGAGA